MARGVLEIYYPKLKPSDKKIEDKEPGITRLVKEILQKATDEKLTPDLFTAEAGTQILGQSKPVAQFLRTLGPVLNLDLMQREESGDGVRQYRYRITYNSTKLGLSITLTKENKIAGILLQP